jgi:uncharacterized protein YozE (UPF0346 family)
MQTYFISNGTHVKIGRTYKPVEKRLAALQTASHLPLEILLIFDGDREKEFHLKFDAHRTSGEWFLLSPELREFTGAPGPFFLWLVNQVSRHVHPNDFVSDFAHDAVLGDTCFPKHSTEYSALRNHLVYSHTSCRAARVGLARAYRQWQLSIRRAR